VVKRRRRSVLSPFKTTSHFYDRRTLIHPLITVKIMRQATI